MVTTVQVYSKTKEKLERLKIHPREPYNRVIERLMEIRTDEGVLSDETIRSIEKSLEDVKAGRVYTMEQVKKRMGTK